MKIAVEKRILIFAFVLLTLAISVNTGLNVEGFRRDYRDGLVLRCQTLASGLKSVIEKVLALGIPLDEIEGINGRCQEIVRSDPEITFCLVENAVGQVLYANDPAFQLNAEIEFLNSSGQATVVSLPGRGTAYNVTATIDGPDGRLAGRIHIGFPTGVIDQRIGGILRRTILVLAAALLVVFGVIVVFTRRNLGTPIKQLCQVAQEITSGNFKVSIPPMETREFEELGDDLRLMATSLADRDRRIQESYADLELANRELQQSYELQEKISTELGHSQQMYRALLEDASDAILVSDEEDRIVLINKATEAFLGLGRAETIGRNLFVVFDQLHCGNIEQLYGLVSGLRSGQTLECEVSFQRPAEERRIIGWVRGSAMLGPDGRRMVQATIRDITQEKAIKDNLEQVARDLQSLNQMKDSFLGMASHELKTPLTVIIGYSELILSESAGKADKTVLAMVKYIVDAAERLSSIVRDMVDVSLLDRRQLPMRIEAVNLNELIQTAAREMEYFFQVRRQKVELSLASALPPVTCDPDRIFQVLSNLISNAVKFTPDGGTITVETRLSSSLRPPAPPRPLPHDRDPIDTQPQPYAEILVRDTGIGIDAADQAQIFEKFYEVGKIEEHFTGKMAFKGKGTGLGLTIVKGIVDMHAGAIWVESSGCDPQTCPGSTFHILLPLAPPTPVSTETPALSA